MSARSAAVGGGTSSARPRRRRSAGSSASGQLVHATTTTAAAAAASRRRRGRRAAAGALGGGDARLVGVGARAPQAVDLVEEEHARRQLVARDAEGGLEELRRLAPPLVLEGGRAQREERRAARARGRAREHRLAGAGRAVQATPCAARRSRARGPPRDGRVARAAARRCGVEPRELDGRVAADGVERGRVGRGGRGRRASARRRHARRERRRRRGRAPRRRWTRAASGRRARPPRGATARPQQARAPVASSGDVLRGIGVQRAARLASNESLLLSPRAPARRGLAPHREEGRNRARTQVPRLGRVAIFSSHRGRRPARMRGRQEAFRAASDPSSCSSWKCEYIDDAVQCTASWASGGRTSMSRRSGSRSSRPLARATGAAHVWIGRGRVLFPAARRDLRSATETPTEKVPAETPVERTAETPHRGGRDAGRMGREHADRGDRDAGRTGREHADRGARDASPRRPPTRRPTRRSTRRPTCRSTRRPPAGRGGVGRTAVVPVLDSEGGF